MERICGLTLKDEPERYTLTRVLQLDIASDLTEQEVLDELASILADRDGWSGKVLGRYIDNWAPERLPTDVDP
jgi:hypothetical protein